MACYAKSDCKSFKSVQSLEMGKPHLKVLGKAGGLKKQWRRYDLQTSEQFLSFFRLYKKHLRIQQEDL